MFIGINITHNTVTDLCRGNSTAVETTGQAFLRSSPVWRPHRGFLPMKDHGQSFPVAGESCSVKTARNSRFVIIRYFIKIL